MNDQFFNDYLERLENLNRHIHQEVQALPQEALDWSPGVDMNSIEVLVAHIAGSLRNWIGDVALGDPSSRVREREFQTRGESKSDLLARLDSVVDYARDNLPRLSLKDLDQVRHLEKEDRTVGWALLHALEHGYLHLGHIELTRQLWEQKKPGLSTF